MRRLPFLLLSTILLAVGACGDDDDASGVTVVVTTNVLGDVVAAVAGDDATVEVLLPPGADPHDYEPSARQAAAIEGADLVVANGLGLEEGLADVLANADRLLEIAPAVDPLPFRTVASGPSDPHVWMDPLRMATAARLVAAELTDLAPAVDWSAGAEAYVAEMAAVDRDIAAILAPIPPERRKLVTNHDSLGYFADRYGFEVIGTVIPGGATLAEPSSAGLAELVAAIEREGVPAIFAETTEPATLAEALAAEVGGVVVVELYSGSLGEPGSDAGTLAGVLRVDAARIAEALS